MCFQQRQLCPTWNSRYFHVRHSWLCKVPIILIYNDVILYVWNLCLRIKSNNLILDWRQMFQTCNICKRLIEDGDLFAVVNGNKIHVKCHNWSVGWCVYIRFTFLIENIRYICLLVRKQVFINLRFMGKYKIRREGKRGYYAKS